MKLRRLGWRMRVAVPVSLSGAAVLLLAGLPQPGVAASVSGHPAGRLSATSRACSFAGSLYAVRQSRLRRCGYQLDAVRSIRALPGGGRAYLYDDDGLRLEEPVPPRGFDPLTASARQLREYGLPLPSQLGRKNWVRAMRVAKFGTPPRTLIAGGGFRMSVSDTTNSHWAGWLAEGHSDFNDVTANYVEPSISASSCTSNTAEGTWVGLGGWNTNDLAQAGTAYGTGHPHGAFQELITDSNSFPPTWSTWDASAGDTMLAYVTYDRAAPDNFRYFVEDTLTGQMFNTIAYSSNYDGSSADYITEAPYEVGYGFENLANFSDIPFTNADAGYGTTSSVTHVLSYWATQLNITMVNGSSGDVMAFSPSIYGDGSDFTMKHRDCD